MKSLFRKIKDWYDGEFVPHDNDPNSSIVMIGGYVERPIIAKIISSILNFLKNHWKWLLTTIVAVTVPFIVIKYQKSLSEPVIKEETQAFELPSFDIIILNESDKAIMVKSMGTFHLLVNVSPMMDSVAANGRFLLGSTSGAKPENEFFRIEPKKNINLEGKFLNSNLFRRYYESGDLEIRFFFDINGKPVMKDGLLFNENYLIGESIAIFYKSNS